MHGERSVPPAEARGRGANRFSRVQKARYPQNRFIANNVFCSLVEHCPDSGGYLSYRNWFLDESNALGRDAMTGDDVGRVAGGIERPDGFDNNLNSGPYHVR